MIDWNRVEELRAEIGPSDFSEVVEMFIAESDEAIARLQIGRPQPTLEAELHFLKGSALNLGFTELAALCNQGEQRTAQDLKLDLERILVSYNTARDELREKIPANRAA